MTTRIMVYLGDDDRRGRLETIAARVGAIGQRGPSVSKLMQMIADQQLRVEPMETEETMDDKAKNRVPVYDYVGEPMMTRGDYGVDVRGARQVGDYLVTFDPDFGEQVICHVRYAEEMGFRKRE